MDECKRCFSMPFPPRQDGAVGIFFAIALSAALLCAVLALDTGRLYWEGQELQRLADMASLDAVEGSYLTSDTPATPGDLAGASSRAAASVGRNLPENWSVPTTDVQQREIITQDGVRQLCTTSGCDAYGIQVTVIRETCSSIIVNVAALVGGNNSTPSNDGQCYAPVTLSRSAIAARPPQIVAFSATTTLLNICSNESTLLQPLMAALGNSELCVALVGSQGIADASISLLELREGMDALLPIDLSLGTLDELLSADIRIGELIDIFLSAASSDSEHLAALSALSDSLSADILDTPLQLGDILQLGACQWNGGSLAGDSCNQQKTLAAALVGEIGIKSILESAILLANKNNAVNVAANLNLGGLVALNGLSITIIEPPRVAIGPAGCANGETPTSAGCSRWQTEATPGQIGISTGLAVGLPGLLSLDLDIDSTLVGAEVGISSMERTGNLVDGVPEYILYAGANLKPLELDISGNLSLPVLGNLLPQLSDLPLLGPVLDAVLNGLLGGLLEGLGLGLGKVETLISVEQKGPVFLQIGPLTARIAADSDEVLIDWPSNPSSTMVAKNLSGISLSSNLDSILDSSVPLESETKIQTCLLVCGTATYKKDQLATPLNALLPSVINLQQELVTIISGPLLNLLDELLGVKVNSTEVEILKINAGSTAVLI